MSWPRWSQRRSALPCRVPFVQLIGVPGVGHHRTVDGVTDLSLERTQGISEEGVQLIGGPVAVAGQFAAPTDQTFITAACSFPVTGVASAERSAATATDRASLGSFWGPTPPTLLRLAFSGSHACLTDTNGRVNRTLKAVASVALVDRGSPRGLRRCPDEVDPSWVRARTMPLTNVVHIDLLEQDAKHLATLRHCPVRPTPRTRWPIAAEETRRPALSCTFHARIRIQSRQRAVAHRKPPRRRPRNAVQLRGRQEGAARPLRLGLDARRDGGGTVRAPIAAAGRARVELHEQATEDGDDRPMTKKGINGT